MTLIIHTLKVIYFHDTYHLWQPLFSSTVALLGRWILARYIMLVLHEIMYNSAKNKHVYNTYSRQTVLLFMLWGLIKA